MLTKKRIVLIVLYSLIIILGLEFWYMNSLDTEGKYELVIASDESSILTTVEHMTLDEKIGQLIIAYYNSDTYNEEIKCLVEDKKLSGFIISKGNITTYDNTKNYINELQNHSKIPLII